MSPKTSQQTEKSRKLKEGAKRSPSDYQPTVSATVLKRALPQASVEKAKKIFENFSLSKFPKDLLPSNYVHPYKRDDSLHHAERTKHVRDFQDNKIEQHIQKLKSMAEKHRRKNEGGFAVKGIAVALPKASMKKVLPSYSEEKGTVELSDVMDLISKHARGSELYAKGDSTLNRLVLLARIEEIKKNLGVKQNHEGKGGRK
jgi:hypothetical protein